MLKNYKQTLILLASLIIGTIIGLIFQEKAGILNPFGELFLNMMFILIVPLIFLTLTTSIAKIKHPKRLSKVLKTIIFIFVITSIIALTTGLITTYSVKLVNQNAYQTITKNLSEPETTTENLNILNRTVAAISTDDFYKILSRHNLIALVLFSIATGLAINKVGEKAKNLENLLHSANEVVLKLVDFAFLYAPLGLG